MDIWEIASKAELVENRTWESYGNTFPDKENPFLSELNTELHLWTEYIIALRNSISLDRIKVILQDQKSFIKDVKIMLGIIFNRFKSYLLLTSELF